MASHLSCIGIPTHDRDYLAGFARDLPGRGELLPRPDGGKLVVWRDPSGAGLVLNVDSENQIQCVTPTFAGSTRHDAVARGFEEDGKCPYCDRFVVEILDPDGRSPLPIAVQLEDIGITRPQIVPQSRLTMGLTAFAEGIDIWADDKAFTSSQSGKIKIPPDMLVRTQAPAPQVMLAGRVTRSERRENTATEGRFWYLNVRSMGTAWDVVAAEEDAPNGIAPGNVIQGMFWVVGRVFYGLRPKNRWTWVGNLFKRG